LRLRDVWKDAVKAKAKRMMSMPLRSDLHSTLALALTSAWMEGTDGI
jgi:hypothetical protein